LETFQNTESFWAAKLSQLQNLLKMLFIVQNLAKNGPLFGFFLKKVSHPHPFFTLQSPIDYFFMDPSLIAADPCLFESVA